MVGRYVTAEPLSIRSKAKYGSDIIIMTKDGYVALSTIVQQGRISDVAAFSRAINRAIKERTDRSYMSFGWEAILYAKESLFLFNVPISQFEYEQHVMNTVTKRWCRFTAINVSCMGIFGDRLFGGMRDGTVVGLMEGTNDLGEQINHIALPAFNYFGESGYNKTITAAQIISTHQKPSLINLRGYSDFNYPNNMDELKTLPPSTLATWSTNPTNPPTAGSYWNEDFWSIGETQFSTRGWQNVCGFGYAVSVMVRFATIDLGVRWRSTGIRFNMDGSQ